MGFFSEIKEAHIEELIKTARQIERDEFELMSGKPFPTALRESLQKSDIKASIIHNGHLAGIVSFYQPCLMDDSWFIGWIGTDYIPDHPIEFVKKSKLFVANLYKLGYRFENYLLEDNLPSIRWLKAIGFTFDGKDYRFKNRNWLRFEKEF